MPPPAPSAADRPLAWWEWVGVAALAAGLVWLGVVNLDRSARHFPRMTDQGVYGRAAWAVRTGQDPYQVADEHGWHYVYPPPFVLAFTPLADPPPDADRTGYLPFDVQVVIWYALNVLFALLAAHLFALAALPAARPPSRRWWYARLIPFEVVLAFVGYSLTRGQANLFVLAVLAGGFLATVRGWRFVGGLALAAAAAVKVIPALLVLLPLVRLDWRGLLGVAAGLAVLLGVVPVLVWGPGGAWEMNRSFVREVALPGLTNAEDAVRAEELTDTTGTDAQAFHAAIHTLRHLDPTTRPRNSDAISKALHYLIGASMIGATLWAAWRTRPDDPVAALIAFGCLSVVMVNVAPASHMHYYVFALPLVAGLAADDLRGRPGAAVPSVRALAGLFGWTAVTMVPLLPGDVCQQLRDGGLAIAATVALWAWGVLRLGRLIPPPLSKGGRGGVGLSASTPPGPPLERGGEERLPR